MLGIERSNKRKKEIINQSKVYSDRAEVVKQKKYEMHED
jgi:hypothetical protein